MGLENRAKEPASAKIGLTKTGLKQAPIQRIIFFLETGQRLGIAHNELFMYQQAQCEPGSQKGTFREF